ncbi:MAG: DNA polymerase III subunit gamma and tau, partial [Actinomycetota bacterium]|nr:DNA polymerase III subunit gamma and tau [Actinomycetota bacterium]
RKTVAAPAAPDTAAPGGIDAAAVRRVWPDLVARVRDKKRTVAAYLLDATVTSVDGGRLVLSFPHAFHASALSQAPAVDYFRDALKDVLGVDWQVQCEVTGAPQVAAPTLTGFAPGDEAADEPPHDPDAAPPPSPEESAITLLEQSLGAKKIRDA